MLRAGSVLSLDIERLSLGGDGVAHADGMAVFVAHAAPGDRVEAEVIEARPRFARARIRRVLRPSPQRVTPPCPYHFQLGQKENLYCGGCSWQHLDYAAQLTVKRDLVRETLERLGGLRDVTVQPVLGMSDPWRYRNKVQVPVGWDAAGKRMISGFYSPGTHDIVAIDDCLVQPALSVRIVNRARSLIDSLHLRAYDSERHQGWIRHLCVRTSSAGRALLVFVTRTEDFPQQAAVLATLAREFPELDGVYQNVNPARTNVIFGRQWRTLAGAEFMEDQLGRLRFRLSPASFFQVNARQAEVLYDVTARQAGRGRRLLDLYSGVGAIALWLAGQFEEVGGIEEVRPAVADAEINAETNGIDNARFQALPVEDFLRQMDRKAGGAALTVTLDPPRTGCSPAVVKSLIALAPRTIVYVSCDPGTLARDVGLMARAGYAVGEVQPVDLFPHTPHIEVVVQLQHRRPQ